MCPIFNGCEDTDVWSWRVRIRFLSVGMDEKRGRQRKSKHKRRISRSHYEQLALWKQERQDDLRRGLKSALKWMVGFLNTYFELSQFIEIIYITKKCNEYVICLSFTPFVRIFMRNIQTAVSPHPLKTGHMFIWTYSLGVVHTTTS